MTMRDSPEDLLPFYALGGLSELERSQVEEYLSSHAARRAEADEMAVAARALARLSPAVAPSAQVGSALAARARQSQAVRASPSRRSWSRLAFSAACLALAVIAVGWAAALAQDVRRLQEETVQLRSTTEAQASAMAELSSPAAQVVEIPGTQAQPNARARLFADPSAATAVLLVSGLEPTAPGFVYQLWLIRGDLPVGVGLFTVDLAGRAAAKLQAGESVGTYDAIGVSVEPEGGSQLPTGEIVLLGTLNY
jgi:anti-sigma-K factor RskA